MLTEWLSKLSFLANPTENNCFNRGFNNTSTEIYHWNVRNGIVQFNNKFGLLYLLLKSTIFDRFQLAVNNFFHVFETKAFRSIIAVLKA